VAAGGLTLEIVEPQAAQAAQAEAGPEELRQMELLGTTTQEAAAGEVVLTTSPFKGVATAALAWSF
jgi:hypothetical protein